MVRCGECYCELKTLFNQTVEVHDNPTKPCPYRDAVWLLPETDVEPKPPLQKEYDICLQRGHQPSEVSFGYPEGPVWNKCKWCGTEYRFTKELHESKTPYDEPPGPLREENRG